MNNRELYLQQIIPHLQKDIFPHAVIPPVKVSVGLPFGRNSKKAIGQHWCPESSDDRIGSVFISPTIDETLTVLAVLTHELTHAAVGNEHKHGPVFRECAVKAGLEGRMTATVPGQRLTDYLTRLELLIGPYPHSKLNLEMRPTKKQTTRLILMQCVDCDYKCRASNSTIERLGPAFCPCGQQMRV